MTLQLRLSNVKDLWGGASKPTYMYVEGGQSGSLRLELRNLPQIIKCSTKDHLRLIICGSKSELQPLNGDVISTQDFWGESFLDMNRHKWEKDDQWNPYVMQYFNSEHNKEGELTFEVRYVRGLLYQGQIQSAERRKQKFVPFYTGRVPTSNFYNFLDPHEEPRKFNFIEGIYRDQ